MLTHEFAAISRNEIMESIENEGDGIVPYSILKNRKYVCVNDDFILENYEDFLSGYGKFKTYNGNYENDDNDNGLYYYGITIIPHESLPFFISILSKYEKEKCIQELINMCDTARKDKLDVIHFGV